jgi:hydrogenase-4 component B
VIATILLVCALLLLLLAIAAVALARSAIANALVYGATLVLALVCLGAGAMQLFGGAAPVTVALPLGLPWMGAHFRMDALSAFFIVVVDLGVAAASLFAVGYGRHEQAPARVLPFYPAFVAAMNLVVLADDAFTFLLSWEFMSLSSWALVMAHHHVPENVRAGQVYLVMASFGTLALLLAFGLLAGPDGGYTFAEIRNSHPSPAQAALVLCLVLTGAGSKAGLLPLHVWLPLAHPAAPSHVSALMSGVMTKVAVYGFLRIVFDLVGEPAWWWSMVVLALAGVTCAMGVLYALMQHDLKRLLAYHTVENIGIIFIGLGLAWRSLSNPTGWAGRRRWRSPPDCCTSSIIHCSRVSCSSVRAQCCPPPTNATWSISAVSFTGCRRRRLPFWSGAPRFQPCRRSTASYRNG